MQSLSYNICHYPEISNCTSYCGLMLTPLFLFHLISHVYTWQPALAVSKRQEHYFSIATKNDDCTDSGWSLDASLAGVKAQKCHSSKFFSDKLPHFVFPTWFCGPVWSKCSISEQQCGMKARKNKSVLLFCLFICCQFHIAILRELYFTSNVEKWTKRDVSFKVSLA